MECNGIEALALWNVRKIYFFLPTSIAPSFFVVLDKLFNFSNGVYNPILEEKSTGSLYFVSINEVYHKCNGRNCENFFKYKNNHFCENCNK